MARSSWRGRPTTLTAVVSSTCTTRSVRRWVRAATARARSPRPSGSWGSAPVRSLASTTSSPSRAESSSMSSSTSPITSRRSASGRRSSWRSSSMLLRRLVSGVRISWLASDTSRRCCSCDRPTWATIVEKLDAKSPTSPPSTSIGVDRSRVVAIWWVASRRRTMGRARRVRPPTQSGRHRRARSDHGGQLETQTTEDVVGLRQAAGDLQRAAVVPGRAQSRYD